MTNKDQLVEKLNLLDKTQIIDFITALQKSIDNFLLEANKIITNEQLNNNINIEQILHNCIIKSVLIFEMEKNNCIIEYGDSLHVNKEDLESYKTSIMKVLKLMITNSKLYNKQFIAKIQKDYEKIEQYDYYQSISNKWITNPNEIKKIFDELEKIIIKYKKALDLIISHFCEIQTMKKDIETINDCIKINSIALYVKNLINLIIINCSEILEVYKNISSVAANLIISELRKYISQNNIYYKYIEFACQGFDNHCRKILLVEFDKIFDTYTKNINMLHQYAIALSDKLEVILSMYN
jgi:hypothetical protein